MDLTHFEDVAAFCSQAEPFLMAHEAEHNLLLGIGSTLLAQPDRFEHAPYLALVRHERDIVAVALMTPPRNLILSLVPAEALAPAALALIAEDLRDLLEGALPGVMGPVSISRTFAEHWHSLTGQPFRLDLRERIYQLDAVTPVTGVPGQLRRASQADRDILVRWSDAFTREAFAGRESLDAEQWAKAALAAPAQLRGIWLWEDREPVAMAGYGGPTPTGIRIGPVYTPPERRGRGYASACTAALSQHLLDSGHRHCFLFTNLDNPTSNHIYQTIGYRPVGDVHVYQFGEHSLA